MCFDFCDCASILRPSGYLTPLTPGWAFQLPNNGRTGVDVEDGILVFIHNHLLCIDGYNNLFDPNYLDA